MESTVEDRAMVGGLADLRVPRDVEGAQRYAATGFRPLYPERFPWRCVAEDMWTLPWPTAATADVRCVLVEGHEGEHEGRVTWS
jgi:hypothetical protein